MEIMAVLWAAFIVSFMIGASRHGWLGSPGSIYIKAYPLHYAAQSGNVEEARRLLQLNPSLIYSNDSKHSTVLVCAICNGSGPMLELLLDYKADPNGEPGYGLPPLHQAAQWGRTAAAAALIKHGANVNATDSFKATPLLYAISHGYPDKNLDVIKLLLDNGADVNAKDDERNTPLLAAEKRGFKEAINLLLAKGAQINICDAAALGQIDRMAAMLQADPSLLRTTVQGLTPLQHAARAGQDETVQLLLAKGAAIEAEHAGRTALFLAVEHNRPSVVATLLAHQANPNAREGSYGWTPLHPAARAGHLEVVKLLLQAKADVNAADRAGETPLHKALVAGLFVKVTDQQMEIIRLLLANGAAVNATDKHGHTPLYYAEREHKQAVIELLRQHGAIK